MVNSTVAFVTLCMGHRRNGEGSLAATKTKYLQMKATDMCTTSMCALLQHVDPLEGVFAFIDDTTPSEVRSLYKTHSIKQLYGYNATTFPEPHPEISQLNPDFVHYGFVKLLLWNWGQVSGKEYERVLLFDPDFWFVEPPFYLLQKYPLLQPNSVAMRDGPVKITINDDQFVLC